MIGIIGAMQVEVESLKEIMKSVKIEKVSGVDFYIGDLCGIQAVVAVSGVGKVNAAVCAEAMILKYAPEYIINIGVAGGLAEGIKVGDVVIAESVVEHDMDTSPIGDPVGLISGINLINIPCSAGLIDGLFKSASAVDGISAVKGVIASGDQFISSDKQRIFIKDTFKASAAEMEGASIGHVCYLNNVDFCVLRAISDCADGESPMSFAEFTQFAVKNSIKIILDFLENTNK
ncbi:MAG: 5'-methylthioadenosine/adenosylhomocysteine nucleosidase [Oscillospiraceae bacterium]|nr:5'-methylthioadenosine/adenosylhomocysteine nucleosidase [Oscillospiraceae bacterium]